MKIFAINPGSTSTKIALFQGENGDECVFSKSISHEAGKLKTFRELRDQLPYRKQMIRDALAQAGVALDGTDAFVGRGGGLQPLTGGTYMVSPLLLRHAGQDMPEEEKKNFPPPHPAALGSQLAHAFQKEYGGQCFVVNPPDVDEFTDVARMTGLRGVYRESRIHALNQKEIGIRYAASKGRSYDEMNLIICHIGGGISVTAHQKGRMIDSNDIIGGDGPMAPTRCGSLPVKQVIKMCFSKKYSEKEMNEKVSKTGGWADHLGTSDGRQVRAMIENGSEYAGIVYDATIYQIGKQIGAMAVVLKGRIDAVILTGGLAHDDYLTKRIIESVSFLAPVQIMAGEFEMEALAAGAVRVLSGKEKALAYTGIPVWNGFPVN